MFYNKKNLKQNILLEEFPGSKHLLVLVTIISKYYSYLLILVTISSFGQTIQEWTK